MFLRKKEAASKVLLTMVTLVHSWPLRCLSHNSWELHDREQEGPGLVYGGQSASAVLRVQISCTHQIAKQKLSQNFGKKDNILKNIVCL